VDTNDRPVVDLTALAEAASGHAILWTCRTDDLNLNVLTVDAGTILPEHVNTEVDVLLLGVAGEGIVTVDGEARLVSTGQLTVIPKGMRRAVRSAGAQFTYLTCHRRRPGLWPQGLE